MSSGMFRGKDFSNRIELSQLVQDVLKFHCFGCYPPLGAWWVVGWVDGGVGEWGQPPRTCTHTRTCMHTCARACMRNKHDNFMQMAAPIAIGISHWEFPMMSCACACMHARVHAHVRGGCPQPTPPHPPTHPPPGVTPPKSVKTR